MLSAHACMSARFVMIGLYLSIRIHVILYKRVKDNNDKNLISMINVRKFSAMSEAIPVLSTLMAISFALLSLVSAVVFYVAKTIADIYAKRRSRLEDIFRFLTLRMREIRRGRIHILMSLKIIVVSFLAAIMLFITISFLVHHTGKNLELMGWILSLTPEKRSELSSTINNSVLGQISALKQYSISIVLLAFVNAVGAILIPTPLGDQKLPSQFLSSTEKVVYKKIVEDDDLYFRLDRCKALAIAREAKNVPNYFPHKESLPYKESRIIGDETQKKNYACFVFFTLMMYHALTDQLKASRKNKEVTGAYALWQLSWEKFNKTPTFFDPITIRQSEQNGGNTIFTKIEEWMPDLLCPELLKEPILRNAKKLAGYNDDPIRIANEGMVCYSQFFNKLKEFEIFRERKELGFLLIRVFAEDDLWEVRDLPFGPSHPPILVAIRTGMLEANKRIVDWRDPDLQVFYEELGRIIGSGTSQKEVAKLDELIWKIGYHYCRKVEREDGTKDGSICDKCWISKICDKTDIAVPR